MRTSWLFGEFLRIPAGLPDKHWQRTGAPLTWRRRPSADMQSLQNRLIFSATDLSNFLACPHLTLLKHRTALGGPKPRQFPDPGIDVLRQRGLEHEQKFLAGLQERGALRIVDLTSSGSGAYGLERLGRPPRDPPGGAG